MQPDSESNIIRKAVGSVPKDVTPTQKTGAIKKNSTLIGGTPTSSSNVKKKTDISQYFKKLDSSSTMMTTPISNSAWANVASASKDAIESPASQLLNRISSNNYTPLMQMKKTTTKAKTIDVYDEGNRESTIGNFPQTHKVKKALDFWPSNGKNSDDESETTPSSKGRRRSISNNDVASIPNGTKTTPSKPARRCSLLPTSDVADAMSGTQSKPDRRRSIAPPVATETTSMATTMTTTPSTNTRRRSSIHTPKNMTMGTPSKTKNIQPILEEGLIMEDIERTNLTNTSAVKGRRTLYGTKTMEISEQSADSHKSENAIKENHQPPTARSSRRRTMYSYSSANNSPVKSVMDTSNVTTRRPTCYSVKPIDSTCRLQSNEKQESTNNMLSQKTLEVTTNKILNLLSNKNEEAADQSKKTHIAKAPTNRRRTLYTPQKTSSNDITSDSLVPLSSDGICITPTASNMHGKVVACSTLLGSADKSANANANKPIETPPATATTGKLIEESEKCMAPLVFSSTRAPGNRRRTLFDVSMDIITQRLQCINQSARRSLAPTTSSADIPNSADKSFGGGTILTTSDAENTTTSQSSNSCNRVASSDCESVQESSNSTPILNKKRKLFIPNEVLTPPPTLPSSGNTTAKLNSSTTSSKTPAAAAITASEQKKRRRTLLPLSQTLLSSTSTSDLVSEPSEITMVKRRSTLDFEQIKKYQNKAGRKDVDDDDASTKKTTGEEDITKMEQSKKTPVLVYTNMHREQIDVIREVGTQQR